MKVLIAGGGIGGLTAALCLSAKGNQVDVFEQAPNFAEIGAGIQLPPNCTRVLHDLGLEAALRERAFLPDGTQARDWKSGRVIMESQLGTAVEEAYGFPYYHIHRGDLLAVLVAAAQANDNIRLHSDAKVEGIGFESDLAEIAVNGGQHRGDVLIGADGIHSVVRSALWGAAKPQFTGNIAWRAMVPVSRLPDGLIRPMATVFWGPQRHFVHYYVRSGEYVNCVCVVEKDGWEIESWTEPGRVEELRSDFDGWHSDVQMLIEHADHDSLFKWALYDRPPMQNWSKACATLLGDACHPTLPFMAQGAAMAVEDSAVLAACLSQYGEVPVALKHYEQLRIDRTARIQTGSRRNATVFHMSGIKAWARNIAAKRAAGNALDGLFAYNALDVVNQNLSN